MRPHVHQCHRCGNWVCRDVCWNAQTGLCADCSPKIEQELGALQADERVRQIQEKLTEVDLIAGLDLGRAVVARCPNCMTETHGAKFCPECGTSLALKTTCRGCGTEARAGTKFCPQVRPADDRMTDRAILGYPEDECERRDGRTGWTHT